MQRHRELTPYIKSVEFGISLRAKVVDENTVTIQPFSEQLHVVANHKTRESKHQAD